MPPINDNFANATELTGTSGTLVVDTTGNTLEAGEPDWWASGNGSVWYKIVAGTTDKWVTIISGRDDMDWRHSLGVYSGSAVNALTEIFVVSGNTDYGAPDYFVKNVITVLVPAGETRYIQLQDDSPGLVDGALSYEVGTITGSLQTVRSYFSRGRI